MPPFFRDPRRVAVVVALPALLLAVLWAQPVRHAQADPPALGAAAWGTLDARAMEPDLARRALIRYAMLCSPKFAGGVATAPLLKYASGGLLPGPEATIVSCALGAPPSATCEQLRECIGEMPGLPAPASPSCSGVFAVSALRVGPEGAQQTFRVTESCLPNGGRCHSGASTAFCAGDACTPGETYACDGSDLVVCTEGVRLRGPCPRGTTCGASAGSGVLTCNGTGAACTDDSGGCNGTVRTECRRDSFGKGKLAELDCQPFGLSCVASGSGPSATSSCQIDAAPQCDAKTTPWSCDAGLVKACVAGRLYSYACADLGMAGVCTPGLAGPVCKP